MTTDDNDQTEPENEGWIEALQADTPEEEIHSRSALNRAGKPVMKDGAPLMLNYVTARFVQDRLDAAVGAGNWANMFESLPTGAVRCGISIRIPGEDGLWITKWDVGIPSNIEPDKGAHSDAFKRAGVLWGIARDLYDVRDEDRLTEAAPAAAAAVAADAPPRRPAREAIQQQPTNGGHVQEFDDPDEDDDDVANAPWVCSIHDDVKVVPAGVSKRTGRKYNAFYACPVPGCDEKGPSVMVRPRGVRAVQQ